MKALEEKLESERVLKKEAQDELKSMRK